MKIKVLSWHRMVRCGVFAAMTLLLTGSFSPEARLQSAPTAAQKSAAAFTETMQGSLPDQLSEREAMWVLRSFRNR